MRLLISFSGGETSAYMTWWILRSTEFSGYDKLVVFANTGAENEETLRFVHQCDEHFNFGVRWIEAAQYHGERKSAGYREVSLMTANRDGGPFEDMIQKYGIPNSKFKHCTRSLKLRPIEAFARGYGWSSGSYYTAIGIRSDEADRVSSAAMSRKLLYPLINLHQRTKSQINEWWSKQPFRLGLKGYQGNCAWCWKKSLRKHMTLIMESPSIYDFPRRMERQYGGVGPEFLKDPPPPAGYRRVFFRENRSTDDLFAEYDRQKGDFRPAEDDAAVAEFQQELDLGGGCEESCEVYADEDEKNLSSL